jgi:NADH dehydrogenase
LGIGRGIFQYHRLVIKGRLAWLIHRGYHVLAVPMWERKARVAAGWMTQAIFGRDLVSLEPVQHPRREFVDAAELDRIRSKAA